MSEEKSIAERLAGLETQQGTIQRTLDEMKASMAKMTDAFTRYMTAAAQPIGLPEIQNQMYWTRK